MRSQVGAVAATAVALVLAGCAHTRSLIRTGPGTAPSPGEMWTPPPGTRLPPAALAPPAAIPADLLEKAQEWSLSHLLDLALRSNPETRATWAAARSAAAALGSERGAYYPSVEIDAGLSRMKASAAGGELVYRQTSYGPTLNIDYLVFDLGGRAAAVEEARQALLAADWSHNAAIQDVVLGVEQAYYQFVETKALLEARQADVKEAETNLDAAEQRHKVGVATIADVLQARTALSQAQLSLEIVEGQIQTMKGALATAVGIPANTPFDVAIPRNDLPLAQVSDDVERLIRDAQANRPDLAAARSLAAKAQSHVAKVRSDGRLSLGFSGQAGRVWYGGGDTSQDTYSASVLLRIPVFSGFSHRYDTQEAQADRDRAEAQIESLQQQIIYQVWVGYFNFKTAVQRVKTSATLVESASQSEEVALGRYKAGVGSILDLLVAQAGLSSARAQQVAARTDWYLSLAQLARDTGTLWPPAGTWESAAPRPDGAPRGNP
jgi:outer membrane protein